MIDLLLNYSNAHNILNVEGGSHGTADVVFENWAYFCLFF